MADEAEVTGQTKRKYNMLTILVAALVVVVAGDLVVRGLNYFRGGQPAVDAAGAEYQGADPGSRNWSGIKSTLPLDPFLVNLADKDMPRYLKASFHLGLEEDSGKIIRDPVTIAAMRDSIISILSSKTSDQVLTVKGKEMLRQEIRVCVNAVAPKMKIHDVYIVEFVVQL